MILPSITTLSFGAAVLAAFAIVAWYVSRRTPVLPYLPSPSGRRDLSPSGRREPMRKATRGIREGRLRA